MESSVKARTEELIEELMRQLDPDSPRYRVLASARQFKSSWVDLGEKLLKVKREGLFHEWGYADFIDYCRKEVRIKQPTAQKLTLAYRYLEKQEPDLLKQEQNPRGLPDYRAVDLLRQAEEEQQLSQDEIAQLRQAVLKDQRSFPTVRGRFNQANRAHLDRAGQRQQALQTVLSAARRLANALDAAEDLKGDIEGPLGRLTQRLEGELAGSIQSDAPR